ncbi:FMN-binding protein [Demequina subtropica]|uniref:FMN-binding protein n=1 Tax=Demequina subtropica TaxID=1638989 RepID=UPI00078427E1|nr:FMN-binding protein [Demequina subtropica]
MKRSSGIIVTGISATLLSAGAVMGSGFLDTGTSTSTAASSDSTTALDAPSDTPASSSTDTSTDTSTSTESATPDTSGSSGSSGTYDGEAVSSRYGTFQAEITVEDGVMTEIAWLQSGEADHHSQAINDYAIPVLEDAILQAQSTDVGYVSGASYTSDAVEQAIESAMQVAGIA